MASDVVLAKGKKICSVQQLSIPPYLHSFWEERFSVVVDAAIPENL